MFLPNFPLFNLCLPLFARFFEKNPPNCQRFLVCFFQVHGEVCLKKHVSRLVANNKYRETPKFERSRNVELRHLALDDDDGSGLLMLMVIYGYLWLSMVIYGYLWLSMVIYGYLWLSMVIYGYLWLSMVIYGYLWLSMVIYGYLWLSMVIYGYLWLSMVIYGYLWLLMVINGY